MRSTSSNQKDLKLAQCLDIDEISSPSKFGEITQPGLHFVGRSVFYRPAFDAILQIVL